MGSHFCFVRCYFFLSVRLFIPKEVRQQLGARDVRDASRNDATNHLSTTSRPPLVIDGYGEDAADLRLELPVPGDPRFGGAGQH